MNGAGPVAHGLKDIIAEKGTRSRKAASAASECGNVMKNVGAISSAVTLYGVSVDAVVSARDRRKATRRLHVSASVGAQRGTEIRIARQERRPKDQVAVRTRLEPEAPAAIGSDSANLRNVGGEQGTSMSERIDGRAVRTEGDDDVAR